MQVIKVSIIVVLALTLIVGCSSRITEVEQSKFSKLETENGLLKEQIAQLIEEKNKSQLVALNEPLSMTYISYNEKKRFVPRTSQILALPTKGSYIFRPIEPNTVVSVFDAVDTGQNGLWLYVEIPVYDTPMNMKGWIQEAETETLTRDNVKLVQSDVSVKKGTNIYQVNEFEKISTINPITETYDMRGRLVEKRNGWAKLSCPGGADGIWVQEKDLIYPIVE